MSNVNHETTAAPAALIPEAHAIAGSEVELEGGMQTGSAKDSIESVLLGVMDRYRKEMSVCKNTEASSTKDKKKLRGEIEKQSLKIKTLESERTRLDEENERNKTLLAENESKSTSLANIQSEKTKRMVTEMKNMKEEYLCLKREEDKVKHTRAEVQQMHDLMVEKTNKSNVFEANLELLEDKMRMTDKRGREKITEMKLNMETMTKKYHDLEGYMCDNIETQRKIMQINSDQKKIQEELKSLLKTGQGEGKKKRKTE